MLPTRISFPETQNFWLWPEWQSSVNLPKFHPWRIRFMKVLKPIPTFKQFSISFGVQFSYCSQPVRLLWNCSSPEWLWRCLSKCCFCLKAFSQRLQAYGFISADGGAVLAGAKQKRKQNTTKHRQLSVMNEWHGVLKTIPTVSEHKKLCNNTQCGSSQSALFLLVYYASVVILS